MPKKIRKRRIKKVFKRAFTLVFLCLVICGTVFVTLGKIGMEILEKKQETKKLEEKLADLEDQEVDLRSEINKLNDSEYLARYAREKYFYSKDNEIILRIPENKN